MINNIDINKNIKILMLILNKIGSIKIIMPPQIHTTKKQILIPK